ncbi:MAG: response regulator [Saccharospirillum sp.]
MKLLLVEDDTLMRDLLRTLAISIDEQLNVHEAGSADEAIRLWHDTAFDLVLCDWHLPGALDGIDLVRHIRKQTEQIPILMVTGQADRQKVIASSKLGVNAFISKPFKPEDVIRRLKAFLQPDGAGTAPRSEALPGFSTWAADLEHRQTQLDTLADVRSALSALHQETLPTARSLSKAWQGHAAITTHLIRLANSASMSRQGTHVGTLLDAIALMGVEMALQQVLALSLNDHGQLRDPRLHARQGEYAKECQALAQQAAQLATEIGDVASSAYTAGLLHRIGEMALLQLAQHYLDQGGDVTDPELDDALLNLSSRYGNALKVEWHLPLTLRERIGASHWLPRDAVRRELILMRVAACQIKGETGSTDYQRALRQLGLDGSPASMRQSPQRNQ